MSEREGENREEWESKAESSRLSSRTRLSSRYGSIRSVARLNECLSEREIGKIKKLVVEKEKEERRGNVVIKGWEIGDRITNKKAEEFIKKELDVEIKVKRCRISGKVVVVSLEEEEMKREIMRNKRKLKGKSIFIENDLMWEERKIQEKMGKWVGKERRKGKTVKMGFARVMIDGNWEKWEEIEEEIIRRKERDRDRELRELKEREMKEDIVREFKVGERVDSDHMPMMVEIKGNGDCREEEEEGEEERKTRIRWDKKAIENFKKGTEKILDTTGEELEEEQESVERKWLSLKKVIGEALVKEEWKWKRKGIGHKEWWDKSCMKMKRRVHREFRNWRRGRISREKYMEARKTLKKHVENRKRKKKKEEEEELRNLRNKREVWEFINRRRGKRKQVKNNIDKEGWKEYFMELLEVIEENTKEERTFIQERKEDEVGGNQEEEEGEEELKEEEIIEAIDKLKRKKAIGIDEIPTEVLRRRLEEEVEAKELLPESQGGFRRGRGILDNIFVLNHIVQREKNNKKDREIYAMFVDFKVAFDNIDRKKLWEILKEKKINRKIIGRLEKFILYYNNSPGWETCDIPERIIMSLEQWLLNFTS
ncbi:trichohyalin-like [Harpegnathos saltator]|uniref:trichohyalin-like n=1 Tax=Harpegnathos saltator TaxID=610380 RepID=UPI000DBEE850|nr:trichohyalin-like [Harpegnathos saltator]